MSKHVVFNDVDLIAEDVRGAVTGIEDVCVTHLLYADDLTLLSNEAGALQIIGTLAYKDSFQYHSMMFYRTLDMAKSAENASRAMLTSAYCRFIREHTLAYRPHASLWLAKTCCSS
eukprot:552972-Pelagomonas_calceolata.AAC.1